MQRLPSAKIGRKKSILQKIAVWEGWKKAFGAKKSRLQTFKTERVYHGRLSFMLTYT
jgi:hypothetical protein